MRFVELESERLRFRKFRQDDFDVVFDWMGNAENMKYRRGEPGTEAETHGYINWAISSADAEHCENYEYAVELLDSGALIGAATLMHTSTAPEIGWTLHRNYWRQGFGTEIGRAMLKLGFDKLDLRRIVAGCNAENSGSYRIMEIIGMRREAIFVKAQTGGAALNNRWCDRYQYAVLQEEWKDRFPTELKTYE